MDASRHVAAVLAALALCVASCTGPVTVVSPVPTPPGTTTPATARSPARVTDVNCDGVADIVFGTVTAVAGDGTPFRAGSVTVRYGGSDLVQVVDQLAMGDRPYGGTGSRFGGSVVTGDLNVDGCSDVVVGDSEAVDGPVWALWGSREGISPARSSLLLSGDPALGFRLAFVPLPSPVLVVSSNEGPRLYPVMTDGTLGGYRLLTLRSRTNHGDFPDDNYGDALAASGDLLVVSSPQYDDEGAGYGGEVWVVRLLPGLEHEATWVGQDSPGVPGSYRLGDGFGQSVSLFGGYLAISEPGAHRPGAAGSGRVHAFRVAGTTGAPRVTYLTSIDAGTARIPGAPPLPGFGRTVLVFQPCAGSYGVLVQAGFANDASSSATAVPFSPTSECPATVLGRHLAGWVPIGILRGSKNEAAADTALVVTNEQLRMVTAHTTFGVPLDAAFFTVLAPPAA